LRLFSFENVEQAASLFRSSSFQGVEQAGSVFYMIGSFSPGSTKKAAEEAAFWDKYILAEMTGFEPVKGF